MHTGTGRISRVLIRSMSLYELWESTGEVSFQDILEGKDILGTLKLSLEDLASVIVRGGWPASIDVKSDKKYIFATEYVKSLIHEDVREIEGIERNPEKMQNVLRSLARNIATQVSTATIERDVKNCFGFDISRPTIADYLNTLERLFVIENVKATNLNFRSKHAIRTKPKRYFVDPSIATAILEVKPQDLVNDLNLFGFMFESLCMRDLKIYTGGYGENITFYRDEKDFEVDAIFRTSSGKWGAIEIKLGAGYIDEAANNLLKFKERIDIKKCGEPAFLMVLTGTSYSYKREDEVVYAGGVGAKSNLSYYLYTSNEYWTVSPYRFSSAGAAYAFYVDSDSGGIINLSGVNNTYGVRPVINLSSNVTVTGSGTIADPYIVS